MKPFEELAGRWLQDAVKLEEYGDERVAAVCRRHVEQLDDAARTVAIEELTLTEAAAESGYSPDRLRHMLSDGSLPNAGRKGSPRIRRGDLPRKAIALDPGTRARQLLEVAR